MWLTGAKVPEFEGSLRTVIGDDSAELLLEQLSSSFAIGVDERGISFHVERTTVALMTLPWDRIRRVWSDAVRYDRGGWIALSFVLALFNLPLGGRSGSPALCIEIRGDRGGSGVIRVAIDDGWGVEKAVRAVRPRLSWARGSTASWIDDRR
jgi:hypothetical protein